jgi:ABC-type Na+ efflux pump permease subunit
VSLVVLLILAIVWAVFLIPQVVRARAERGPADSVGAFRNQLSVLERTSPSAWGQPARPVYRTASKAQIAKRRRDVLTLLLVAMSVTLLQAVVFDVQMMLYAHLLFDGLFVAYVVLLARIRALAVERETKVHYLPGHVGSAPEPALVFSQSGS